MDWNKFFEYKEGKLFWKIAKRKIKIGQEITSTNSSGYLKVCLEGKYFLVHRVIYEMFNGLIPSNLQIDHIDGNRKNNNISNLRLATIKENSYNREKQSNNTSGFKGVNWSKYHFKWRVRIGKKHLGYFNDLEEAYLVYQKEAKQQHNEFYRE
jgi:hypothetical protein